MLGGGYGVNVKTNANIRRNSMRPMWPMQLMEYQ